MNNAHKRIAIYEDALLKILNGDPDVKSIARWALKEGTKIEIPGIPEEEDDDDEM
jgi:hypothetical protein